MPPLNRRQVLARSSLLAAGLATNSKIRAAAAAEGEAPFNFRSDWHEAPDRVWLGAEYWANPLQDWRVAGGRAECVFAAPNRNLHLLTRQLGEKPGTLHMSVRLGRVEGGAIDAGKGSAGFRIGIQGPLGEYRNNLIFGRGLDAGITADGGLFIGALGSATARQVSLASAEVELRLNAKPQGDGYVVLLSVHDGSGKQLAQIERSGVPAAQLRGNLALVANYAAADAAAGAPAKSKAKAKVKNSDGAANRGVGQFWFADWQVGGAKVETGDDRAFGPILFSQYTLSGGVLKLTAQMPPLGEHDSSMVRLQLESNALWETIAEAPIDRQARTATFRLDWPHDRDVKYRLAYDLKSRDATVAPHYFLGVVRRDPVDQDVLTVADISCNTHAAFPNADYTRHVAKLNPDLLAFVGDQFYESSGGYGVTVAPLDRAILDYLRKWYLHGWTWRELLRDRPSVSLPDDHDVYQGNIWGESGAPQAGTQEQGGYRMPADWVNVVTRTQTAHHPDPYDPAPIKQGLSQFFGALTYGRISFAILADRMYKSAPEGKVPPTGGRGDHVTDPNFDPRTADLPGLELLGPTQMKFLREWAADWRGAEMKAVISQTIFTAMATTHGGGRERLRADYDANGWPQSARNTALRELRKSLAFHIAGDQHLPALVHYGIDEYGDAGVAFAGPAVNVGYPRWWEPAEPGKNRSVGASEITGDFLDHFGNRLTVLAVVNGAEKPRETLLEMLADRASGLGLVRFDKRRRTITVECWPFLTDPTDPAARQFPGWPMTIRQLDNYGRKPLGHLPALKFATGDRPVVQVIDEASGETVYALRVGEASFRPFVFSAGKHTVRVSDPERGRQQELRGLVVTNDAAAVIDVRL